MLNFLKNYLFKNIQISINKKIIIYLSVILGLFWIVFFSYFIKQEEIMIKEQLRQQALGIYHYLSLSRMWIADQGGVYVHEDGLNTEKLITPSLFTDEIARISRMRFPFEIKISLLNTQNPYYKSDSLDEESIRAFQEGKLKESFTIISGKYGKKARFIAPLHFENECIVCHQDDSDSAEKIAKVIGGLNIIIDAKEVFAHLDKIKYLYSALGFTSLVFALALVWNMIKASVLNPLHLMNDAAKSIKKGNLATRLDFKKKCAEWQEVGESFNQMVATLSDHQKDLEREIQKAICELQNAYLKLKETEKYRTEFFSNITHDLKTPITAIKGAVDLIQKNKDNEIIKQDDYLKIIKNNSKKLSKMLTDLLDCSKIESAGLELNKEINDIGEIIEDAILMMTPLSLQKNIKINYDPPQNFLFFCDRQRVEQAITNIISNAIKFSENNKDINVNIYRQNNEIFIEIEDFGIGIPQKDHDKIFQKFYRRKNEKATEGMGLGLSITKAIIEAHNGKIWIEQPLHEGSIFYISFRHE